MKKLFILSVFALSLSVATRVSAGDFLAGFEDMPLMGGLIQIERDGIAFENEDSRYLEAVLTSDRNINFSDVQKFYRKVLPQLGWTEQTGSTTFLQFTREHDTLEITQTGEVPLLISISMKNRN